MFGGPRSHLLGFFVAIFFISAVCFYLFSKKNKRRKVIIFALLFFFLLVMAKFADKNRLNSMIHWEGYVKIFLEKEEFIKLHKSSFCFKEIPPKLYAKGFLNRMGSDTNIFAMGRDWEADHLGGHHSKVASNSKEEELYNTKIYQTQKQLFIKSKERMEKEVNDIVAEVQYDTHKYLLANKTIQDSLNQTMQEFSNSSSTTLEVMVKNEQIPVNVDSKEYKDLQAYSQQTNNYFKDHLQETTEKLVKHSATLNPSQDLSVEYGNVLFRYYIWRDMIEDMIQEKAILGINMGKPQRSKTIEMTYWAREEWERDGWITPHNSLLHIIYRAGIIGMLFVYLIFRLLIYTVRGFVRLRSYVGIMLCSSIIYWLTISCFLVILELPYSSIPFWSLWGVTLAYLKNLESAPQKSS